MESAIIRYNSARLFAESRTQPGQLTAVSLVTDFSFGFNVEAQEVKSLGYGEVLRPIISNQRPVFSFSYFLSDVDNEKLFRMPVTSEQALLDKIPLFTGIEPFDMFFLTEESGGDLDSSGTDKISTCAFVNSILKNYSFRILSTGYIKVSVTFEADNVIFKKFKDIYQPDILGHGDPLENMILDYDVEDIKATNQPRILINDGSHEVSLDTGGYGISDRLTNFEFSANLEHKILHDFGQFHHKRLIKFPVKAKINLSAFIGKMLHGELDNIICGRRTTDFLIANSVVDCDKYFDDKSGMLFKGAKLNNQQYQVSVSKGGYLTTDMGFDLDISKTYGAWISQHVSTENSVFVGEDTEYDPKTRRRRVKSENSLLNIVLEDGSGGKILSEVALEMFSSLRNFSDSLGW